MRKHAYIIVANSISEVLMTSVKMIDDPMNDIYILFDQKANLLRKKNVLESIVHKSKLDICEQIVNWGGVFTNQRGDDTSQKSLQWS